MSDPQHLKQLTAAVEALLVDSKGILAMDEDAPTCHQRFARCGIPETDAARLAYRELIVTTPGLAESVSGVILYDETIRQKLSDNTKLVDVLNRVGIVPGVNVDGGDRELAGCPGERVTTGLDALPARLDEYLRMGARFAKWRAPLGVGDGLPSRACVEANMHALARYAAQCQAVGIVPIVEPDVVLDGDHSLERCFEVTEEVLRELYHQLYVQRVRLEGTLLKPNMVTPGKDSTQKVSVDQVADATVACLKRAVPAAVPGIAFLSGGMPRDVATARLNAMNARHQGKLPWVLTFSFARALHQPAMDVWKGQSNNLTAAQRALAHRARLNAAAVRGQYYPTMEETSA